MRVSTACFACRSRRRKCNIPSLGNSCTYCTDRGLLCTRDSSTGSQVKVPESTNATGFLRLKSADQTIVPSVVKSPRDGINGLPPPEICLELVNLYFDYIHDSIHSLFHRPSLIRDLETGKVPSVILFAIIALSARFSSNPYFSNTVPRERGNEFAKESNRLLDLRDISMMTLQASVLLGVFATGCGEAASESVYYCVACRIANLLDLVNRPYADAIEREVNIRVWRTLYMNDVWSSAGVRLPRQMPTLENIPLPIDEVTFLSLRPTELLPPDFSFPDSTASSLVAQMIHLNRILVDIHSLNERTVSGATSGVSLENEVMDLSNALDNWHSNIPSFLHDTLENIRNFASQGLGRVFVAVYLGYYHYGQLLFYQFLHGEPYNTVLSAQLYADKCKNYAENLCQIVYASYSILDCDVQYTMVGHILVIASTVQIHTLLFSENELQIAAAKTRLERNFEILSELRNYWPTLDISFIRLQAFHKACRTSMNESFRLDQWMLRFLLEFAKPIDEKIMSGSGNTNVWSLENISDSPET